MIKIGKWIFLTLLVVFYGLTAFAKVQVNVTADRKVLPLGESLTVTLIVSGTEEFEVEEPRLPDLDGFDLLNSWDQTAVSQKLVSTPTGMQFETMRRKEFHFMIAPKALGEINVGAFEVVVNGQTYRTKPMLIRVTKEAEAPRSRRGVVPPNEDPIDEMLSAEEEMFRQLIQRREQLLRQVLPRVPEDPSLANPAYRSLPTNPNEAFFIQVEVDKTEVYEGEQITANWYVYTRGQMESLDRLKFPSLRGFWKEIIEEVPTIQFMEEIVNGIPYKKALLASHALFPIKAGNAVIDEFKIKSRVRTLSQGGFFGKALEYTKSSQRVNIKVKPLPLEGRQRDFTGAVGQFEVTSQIEGEGRHPVNQPLTLRIRFEGSGNAKTIELPAIEFPAGVEVFETKSESRFFKNGKSYKQFDVLLVPRQLGTLTIPGFTVSMFDPQTSKYYSRSTNPLMVEIIDNPNAPVGSAARLSPGKKAEAPVETLTMPDIYLEPQGAHSTSIPLMAWALVYGITLLGFAIKGLHFAGAFHRQLTLKDQVQKRVKKSQNYLAKNDFRHVGTEMMNAYYLVLGRVTDEGASLSLEKLLDMTPPSLRREYGSRIQKSFEYFQTLGFAPEELLGSLKEKDEMQKQIKVASEILQELLKADSN